MKELVKVTNCNFIVYKATSLSNKIYIGITSESLLERISKHKYQSKHKTKYKFAKAINKYGIETFKWEILKNGLSKTLAIKYEKYYIQKFNTYKKGYNSTLGGEGAFGYKWDKELHKIYHNQRVEKYYNNVEYKEKQSKIIKKIYTDNPNLGKERGDRLRTWINKNKEEYERNRVRGLRTFSARLKNAQKKNGKPFNVYNFITKTYVGTWEIQNDCAKELNLSRGKIGTCLNGKRNFHKDYIFKYKNDLTVINTDFNDEWLTKIKRKPNGT